MIEKQSNVVQELDVGGVCFHYCSLRAVEANSALAGLARLPFSLRVLAENLLRHADSPEVRPAMLAALARGERGVEIPFWPARVLLQDMLGVPVMVDLAALRDAVAAAGGDPLTVNPRIPVDFVIDHSVVADVAGSADAAQRNVEIEYARNRERFGFLAWCQGAFRNFRVVPPDSGIVHQINVERLARVVWTAEAGGSAFAYPDTVICNDSHTPMVNAIGVLGWGVGGIEAEAAMLGRALTLQVPEVVGVRVRGTLPAGTTATDVVLDHRRETAAPRCGWKIRRVLRRWPRCIAGGGPRDHCEHGARVWCELRVFPGGSEVPRFPRVHRARPRDSGARQSLLSGTGLVA